MNLTYYGYNAFLIEAGNKRIILDPGQDLHWRRLDSLIPRRMWDEVDLILVTHGDADHAEYVVHVAAASGAPVVCHPNLAKRWARRNLAVVPVNTGETIEVTDIRISGVPARHGPALTLFERTISIKPWFVGIGTMGFLIDLEGKRLLNLGDTLLLDEALLGYDPEVLMIPIGGMMTMDEDQALQAVRSIKPRVVIPIHYNWDILLYHRPADIDRFIEGVEQLGCRCLPLSRGETATR